MGGARRIRVGQHSVQIVIGVGARWDLEEAAGRSDKLELFAHHLGGLPTLGSCPGMAPTLCEYSRKMEQL